MCLSSLTPREYEVYELLAEGLSDSEIGARLFISEVTVGTHLVSIYRKLEVRNRTAVALYASKLEIDALHLQIKLFREKIAEAQSEFIALSHYLKLAIKTMNELGEI